MTTAAQRWREDLAAWAIPDEILAQAPESPWIHPVAMFAAADEIPDSPSHRLARSALAAGGSVLDVGSGGGRAAFALVPPAAAVVGVDHQAGMLAEFAAAAEARGVDHVEVIGDWPAVEQAAPLCDVVVCHHVVYNVADIVPFVRALSAHARRRVVLELPVRHPLSGMSPLWHRFWGLERPVRPTVDDLVAVLRDEGVDPGVERWEDVGSGGRAPVDPVDHTRFVRIRLCLPADRDPEVAAALDELGPPPPREVATVWWDV